MLTINVVGTPAPQGSKKGFYNAAIGRVQMVESSKKVKPWRQDVKTAATEVIELARTGAIVGPGLPLAGPLHVEVVFYLARPGYHFGTGRNAGVLKPTAPSHVDKKPDVDKLLRSTLDGLKEAGIYRDDAQVAQVLGCKRYADAATGARITVRPLDTPVSVPAVNPRAAGTDHPSSVQEALL